MDLTVALIVRNVCFLPLNLPLNVAMKEIFH
jgi:hypothetical protein